VILFTLKNTTDEKEYYNQNFDSLNHKFCFHSFLFGPFHKGLFLVMNSWMISILRIIILYFNI